MEDLELLGIKLARAKCSSCIQPLIRDTRSRFYAVFWKCRPLNRYYKSRLSDCCLLPFFEYGDCGFFLRLCQLRQPPVLVEVIWE